MSKTQTQTKTQTKTKDKEDKNQCQSNTLKGQRCTKKSKAGLTTCSLHSAKTNIKTVDIVDIVGSKTEEIHKEIHKEKCAFILTSGIQCSVKPKPQPINGTYFCYRHILQSGPDMPVYSKAI